MAIQDRSESRDGYKVRVLAIHTTEGTSYTAEGLRDAAWWEGSSHAIADGHTLLSGAEDGCVDYSLAAWTLRDGNRWSENCELVALARYTREEWLARPGLLDNAATWLAERSKATGIPLVKISAYEYASGGTGVIGHVDHTIGYKDGSHTDPGPNFPYDVVIGKARAMLTPERLDEMTPEQAKMLKALYTALCTPVIQGKTLAAAVRELLSEQDVIVGAHAAK